MIWCFPVVCEMVDSKCPLIKPTQRRGRSLTSTKMQEQDTDRAAAHRVGCLHHAQTRVAACFPARDVYVQVYVYVYVYVPPGEVDKTLHTKLGYILDGSYKTLGDTLGDVLEQSNLPNVFAVNESHCPELVQQTPLKENGEQIAVTEENKEEWVHLFLNQVLISGIARQAPPARPPDCPARRIWNSVRAGVSVPQRCAFAGARR